MHPKTLWATLGAPVAFSLVLGLVLAVFWPGLSGPFFFDDLAHLPKLAGQDGAVDSVTEVIRLLLPDHGGSGRPLSYLALLIDGNTWPAEPAAFKRTNLLLHLLNGVLVFALVRLLTRLIRPASSTEPNADWVALGVMALWLVHPIQLSPTMMVIQRMALLGGLFSLLALLAYAHGRRLAVNRPRAGYLWLTFGFGTALVLGVLSKESALMTVCYVIALEMTVLTRDHPPRPTRWGAWAALFLGAPLALLTLYLIATLPANAAAYLNRDFNLSERLMTEGRVLWQYLRVMALPSLSQSGPFNDDYMISRGLLEPISTLVALVATTVVVGLALWGRRRWPLFAFAILWFFLGHLLESTVLPLEIYFEHRNYLPMLGPVFALVYAALRLPLGQRRLAALGLTVYFAIEAGITFSSAKVWGDEERVAIHWSMEHPASSRAQLMAYRYWAGRRNGRQAVAQMDFAIRTRPDFPGYYLRRLVAERCLLPDGAATGDPMAEIEAIAAGARFDASSPEVLDWLVTSPGVDECGFSYAEIQHLFDIFLANPNFSRIKEIRANFYIGLAKLHKTHRNLDATITALDHAFAAYSSFEIPLDAAFYLAGAGLFEEAETYVQKAANAKPTSAFARVQQASAVNAFAEKLAKAKQASEAGAPTAGKATGAPETRQ